jgi:CheY-like chemotaxis protein
MKPVILTVDDDPQVLRSVERDLRREYGNEFRIIRADSGITALEILKQLKLRNEPPAVVKSVYRDGGYLQMSERDNNLQSRFEVAIENMHSLIYIKLNLMEC